MKYTPFFFFIFIFQSVFAQQELGTHFMQSAWQSNKTNPALITDRDYHFIVSLPSVYYNFYHNGASYNDLLRTVNGNTVLDFSNLINELDDDNNLKNNFDIETISIAWQLMDKLTLSFGHALRSDLNIFYPKTLPQLLWNGNSQFIGQTIDFGPRLDMTAYQEFGVGAAFNLSKLTIGAKVKVLNGIGNIQTAKNVAQLYTDDDIYQLTLSADYLVNTSAFLDINSLDDFTFNTNITDNLFSANTGFALDLGLRFKVNEKLDIAASATDLLGQINWANATSYSSNGSYTYNGINLNDFITNDEVDLDVKLDTLKTVFNFQETSNTTYTSKLPTKIYLSANYKLNDLLTIGGLYYLENDQNNNNQAIALSARAKLAKLLTLGAVYSVRNRELFNLGLNLECKLGPVQLVAMSDNILGIVNLLDSRNVNGRVGLNLIF